MSEQRELLRHTLATLAYRGGKAVSSAPDGFSSLKVNDTTRTPGRILSHIGDLMDWGLSLAKGKQAWSNSSERSWNDEVDRFFASLAAFDEFLASDQQLGCSPEKLFQGPIADAFTHVGQIALLRRMAGGPIKGENYFEAEITAGRVGSDQSSNRIEFD